jgi:hypothetical protein
VAGGRLLFVGECNRECSRLKSGIKGKIATSVLYTQTCITAEIDVISSDTDKQVTFKRSLKRSVEITLLPALM